MQRYAARSGTRAETHGVRASRGSAACRTARGMSSGPTLLDDDLLDQFEATLRSHRIGILEAWAPGLTDEQIDAAIAGTDLQLPDEVRTWWRRHNGLVSHRVPIDQIDLLPSNREP